VFRWSPDFPPAAGYPTASGHPVNWLALFVGESGKGVKST
jgi:hypothetical protein